MFLGLIHPSWPLAPVHPQENKYAASLSPEAAPANHTSGSSLKTLHICLFIPLIQMRGAYGYPR